MSASLSTRDRGTLLVGLALAIAIVVAGRVLPGLARWSAGVRAANAEVRSELEWTERAVALLPELLDTLEARSARLVALAPSLVSGDSPTEAAATLASTINALADRAGMRLGSLRTEADTSGAGLFTRLALRGDAAGDIRGVTQFLVSIESSSPHLAVRELAVDQPAIDAPDDRPEELRLHFLIEGRALKRGRRS